MKKSLISLAILLLTLALVFVLGGCGDKNGETRKEEEASVHTHKWVFVNSKIPTCDEGGYELYTCDSCEKTKTVEIAKLPCDWSEPEWHSTLRPSSAYGQQHEEIYATFTCKNNPEHTALVRGRKLSEEVISSTCLEKGKLITTVIASLDGIDYIKVYEDERKKSSCSTIYKYELLGEKCSDGIIKRGVCKWCGKELDETVVYTHDNYVYETTEIIKDGTGCGATVTTFSCPCGEKTGSSSIDVSTCKFAYETIEESIGGGRYKRTETRLCQICGVKGVIEWVHTNYYREYISYNEIWYDSQGSLVYSKKYYNHDREGHTILESTEPAGAHCDDGYYKIQDCQDCDYYEKTKYNLVNHIREKTIIDFSLYCGCDDKITIMGACPCGYYHTPYFDIDYLEDSTPIHMEHSYELIDPNELVPSPFTVSSNKKAYKFDCGLCFFSGYSEPIGSYVYKLMVIKYGDEIIYEWIPEIDDDDLEEPDIEEPDIEEPDDWPIVAEEILKLLEPFNSCQNGCKFAFANWDIIIDFPSGYDILYHLIIYCPVCETEVVWAGAEKDGERGVLCFSADDESDMIWTPNPKDEWWEDLEDEGPGAWLPDEELPKDETEPDDEDIDEDMFLEDLPQIDFSDETYDSQFGRPLTDEEKMAILNYFEKLLEDPSLDEEARLSYERAVIDLRKELGLEEELPNDEEESPKEEELPKDETEKDENDEIFGRPLTDEEKQAIEDYFNSMQENGNS